MKSYFKDKIDAADGRKEGSEELQKNFRLWLKGASCLKKFNIDISEINESEVNTMLATEIRDAVLKKYGSSHRKCSVSVFEDQHYGAIGCPLCELYHTRAAEAVYPFAYQYSFNKKAISTFLKVF